MKDQKTSKKRRRYDAEFKKNALQMLEDGRSVSSVSQALGIQESLLYTWKSKSKKDKLPIDVNQKDEIKQLQKRLKEVEQERDILKKALSIFSRSS
jgi:transposase